MSERQVLLRPTPAVDRGDWRGVEIAFRMNAYYYGFTPTGLEIIDKILCAVACAGKAYHHTEQWNEECSPYEHLRGETPADWINNAAQDAADAIRAALTTLDHHRVCSLGYDTLCSGCKPEGVCREKEERNENENSTASPVSTGSAVNDRAPILADSAVNRQPPEACSTDCRWPSCTCNALPPAPSSTQQGDDK